MNRTAAHLQRRVRHLLQMCETAELYHSDFHISLKSSAMEPRPRAGPHLRRRPFATSAHIPGPTHLWRSRKIANSRGAT